MTNLVYPEVSGCLRVPLETQGDSPRIRIAENLAANRDIDPQQIYNSLFELGQNLWFEWNYKAKELFKAMDPKLWNSEEVDENPTLFLQRFGIDRIKELIEAQDRGFMNAYLELIDSFESYMAPNRETWVTKNYPELKDKLFVYSSFEFGIAKTTQNLQSGGLGALSGDHLKEMSDMGFNCIAIGLGYKYGYFIQRINANGEQETVYSDVDFLKMPKQEVLDKESGEQLRLHIPMYNDIIHVKIWEVKVGRGKLYLLDIDIDDNGKDDHINWKRHITKSLYGQNKFHQAYLFGIAEAMLLDKLGIKADLYHLNESHSGFAIIGLIKNLMEKTGLSFQQAALVIYYKTLFTMHTPIPAGNWHFLKGEALWAFNSDFKRFLDIDTLNAIGDKGGEFNLAQFLLNLCGLRNGVSEEHGSVSREQWSGYAIGEILNGVSIPYWQSPELQELIRNKIKEAKSAQPRLSGKDLLSKAITMISDKEIWDAHMSAKKRLAQYVRTSLKRQRIRNDESPERIEEAETMFDENALTIVVARRFATYKQSDLILKGNTERIKGILKRAKEFGKPVQIIFAGKAHPDDGPGQDLIREINKVIRDFEAEGIRNQVLFLENYNLDMAHYLEQGSDLWLSYPATDYVPEEASATSGEKAAMNGIINMGIPTGFMRLGLVHNENSILFTDINQVYDELDLNNPHAAVNEYYRKDGMPSRKWFSMMRESLRTAMLGFGTDRMIQDYTERYYLRGIRASERIEENDYALAKKVASALENPDALLKEVTIQNIYPDALTVRTFKLNGTYEPIEVRADIKFEGDISPEAVEVSIIFKQEDRPNIEQAIEMTPLENLGNGTWRYGGVIDTLLRFNFLKDVFRPDTRDFRLDRSIDCTYQIKVAPILTKKEKRSEQEGRIRIMPGQQFASGNKIERFLSEAHSDRRNDL